MANANVARGLIPVRHMSGAPYNGAGNVYYVPSTDGTALFIGDPVKLVTDDSDANGIPTVTRAAAGDSLQGVVVGVLSHGDPAVPVLQSDPVYRAADTERYVLVADDPDLLFEAQEDGVGGAMDAGAGGRNVEFIVAAGDTNTGYSGVELDSNTLATTNTLSLRVHRPAERADNDATLTNAKWLVSINLHRLRSTTGV